MESDSYNPKKTLWALLSDDAKRLFNNAKDAMTAAEKRLSEREWKGDDTSYARAALYELDYWVSCTVDVDAVMAALARLQTALDCPDPPSRIFPTGTRDMSKTTSAWPCGASSWTKNGNIRLTTTPGWGRGTGIIDCRRQRVRVAGPLFGATSSHFADCK